MYAIECFESEESLVEQLAFFVTDNASEHYGHLHEFDNGAGVADLVSYRFSPTKEEALHSLSKVSANWTYPLRRLEYRKAFDLTHFANWVGVTKQTAQRVLSEYEAGGFCERRRADTWIKQYQPKPLVTEVTAFEAKLKDWKRALWQASRYRTYANFTWVVLDTHYARAAKKNLEEFRRLNIGLASISNDENLKVHYSPLKCKPLSEARWWQSNAIIAFNETLTSS